MFISLTSIMPVPYFSLTAKKVCKESMQRNSLNGFESDKLSDTFIPLLYSLKMQNSLRSNSCIFFTREKKLHSALQRFRQKSQGDALINVNAKAFIPSQLFKHPIPHVGEASQKPSLLN
jgi:hypothetical protein